MWSETYGFNLANEKNNSIYNTTKGNAQHLATDLLWVAEVYENMTTTFSLLTWKTRVGSVILCVFQIANDFTLKNFILPYYPSSYKKFFIKPYMYFSRISVPKVCWFLSC